MRFLCFGLSGLTPDEHTIRDFRNRLTPRSLEVEAIGPLFDQLDAYPRCLVYLPMDGQTVGVTLVQASHLRMSQDERVISKAGKIEKEIWPNNPANAFQRDV
jgi:hypothetical protein